MPMRESLTFGIAGRELVAAPVVAVAAGLASAAWGRLAALRRSRQGLADTLTRLDRPFSRTEDLRCNIGGEGVVSGMVLVAKAKRTRGSLAIQIGLEVAEFVGSNSSILETSTTESSRENVSVRRTAAAVRAWVAI